MEVLADARKHGSDAMGVLAGRHKRNWIQDRIASEATDAITLYEEGYAIAKDNGDAFESRVHLWRIQAPASETFDAGDQWQRDVTVPESGVLLDGLAAGTYRIVVVSALETAKERRWGLAASPRMQGARPSTCCAIPYVWPSPSSARRS